MRRMRLLFATLVAVASVALVPAMSATTVHFVGAGSSAEFQGFEVAAINDLAVKVAGTTGTVHHWSVKTSNTVGCGGTCTAGVDNRSTGIIPQYGNFWAVWVCNTTTYPCPAGDITDIWAFLSVDTTVGDRLFLAQSVVGGVQVSDFLQLSSTIGATTPNKGNVVSPALLLAGAPANGAAANCPSGQSANCDDTLLPAQVIAALGGTTGVPFTAGMSDVRPEDAKLATNRSLTTNVDTYQATCAAKPCRSWALGYGNSAIGGTTKIGAPILSSAVTGSEANPVQFSLPGYKDPFNTTLTVPSTIKVFPVGEDPIVFVVNRKDTTTGLGYSGASSHKVNGVTTYWAVNVWDQHPYPPNGTPPAPTTRRPLGNLFTGHDCATDNAAFDWPNDGGNRLTTPVTLTNISVWLREPLSGTMNTTEFTEFRRYGTTNGNGPTGNGLPALTSQEQDIDPVGHTSTDNPLNQTCITEPGTRRRGIGTGEVVGSSGPGGVANTTDAIAYTFYSYGNVSAISTSTSYGYLMLDGIDPLFASYDNAAGDAGQPAVNGTGTSYGEVPGCAQNGGGAGTPNCLAKDIWTVTNSAACPSGPNPGCSYPHLRDGTYPAWSELRVICDTAAGHHCTIADDAYGAEALLANMQCDIANSNTGGVPDLLPFQDSASPCANFGNGIPYGYANFVREHYSYELSTGNPNTPPTSTHQSAPQVLFSSFCGSATTTPVSSECGGDAGGWIVPTSSTATGLLQ
jgi:hypothetical protein